MAAVFRICSEHMTPAEASRPDVVRLLSRFRVAPLLAAHDRGPEEDRAVLEAVCRYRDAGITHAGVWPLLAKADGYWPSERDPERFVARMERLLSVVSERHPLPSWVLVDLEPPLSEMRRCTSLPGVAGMMVRSLSPRRFRAASRTFDAVAVQLRAAGARTLACTVPMAACDFPSGSTFWQDAWESPITTVEWDAVAPMTYTTLIHALSAGLLDRDGARRFVYLAARATRRRFGPRGGAFVGLLGTGVLGNEPVYAGVDELRLDAATLRAAGSRDVTAFCLEGLLAQANPEAWLDALTTPETHVPPSSRADALWLALRAAAAAARPFL